MTQCLMRIQINDIITRISYFLKTTNKNNKSYKNQIIIPIHYGQKHIMYIQTEAYMYIETGTSSFCHQKINSTKESQVLELFLILNSRTVVYGTKYSRVN